MTTRPRGNGRGAKPDKLMRDALILALMREAEDADGRPTRKLNLIAMRLVEKAIDGDIQAIKEINDRVDGRRRRSMMRRCPFSNALSA
jgi:hypothetical protein